MKTTIGRVCAIAATGIFVLSAKAETIDDTTPDEYIEYITATGTQYIDTGVYPSLGLKARIDMKWTLFVGSRIIIR